MKTMIFGLGSIGKRYAKIFLDNFDHELFAYRNNKDRTRNDLGIAEAYTWRDVERLKPEVAFITNPTFLHVRTALKCASLGMHLFIEKPLSHRLDDIDLLESMCTKKKLTCYTAYCLRFHPVIRKIRELVQDKDIYHARIVCSSYLPDWRPDQDFKKSYSVSKSKGGGVLLELSHEFDYIQHIFSQIRTAKGFCGRLSQVTIDAEDFADLAISLDNGVHVNLHLDFSSRISERSIKIDFDNGYLIGDLVTNKIDYFYRGRKMAFRFKVYRDDYLKEQMKYFFDNIGNPSIMNNLEESKKLLAKILEIGCEQGKDIGHYRGARRI